jgi:hypothetical protein
MQHEADKVHDGFPQRSTDWDIYSEQGLQFVPLHTTPLPHVTAARIGTLIYTKIKQQNAVFKEEASSCL